MATWPERVRLGHPAVRWAWREAAILALVAGAPPAAAETALAQLSLDRLVQGAARDRAAAAADGVPFLIRFPGAVRGLQAGTAVEINGIRIGGVRSAGLDFDAAGNRFVVLTEIAVQGEALPAIGGRRPRTAEETVAALDALVRAGLRARAGSTRLVGGETVIALGIVANAPPATLGLGGAAPEIPVAASRAEEASDRLQDLLERLSQAPVEAMVADLAAAMAALKELAAGPELRDTLAALRDGATELRAQAARIGARADPILVSLNETVRAANRTADRAAQTLATAERQIGDRSPLILEVQSLLRELNGAARALRLMADYLERNPDALIRGKSDSRR